MSEDRRRFLTAAAGGLLIVKPQTAFGSQANSALEVGVIGCGGRGNYIGGFFIEYTGARVVALADPFTDRMDDTRKKLRAEGARTYKGLGGYRELLASKVDAVAVMSPPYYHPEHVAAALDAGKHVFVAKPTAVDVPGCLSIQASGEKARAKGLSFWVDFQTRSQPTFQEAAARVHRGDIGRPVLGHVYYHAGRLQPKNMAGMSEAENRLRNWVFDKALSGDIIVEQNIHVLDVGNWYLQGHPLRAVGTGGRKARVDVGDCWDHFVVTFTYPNDVLVDFSSAQFTKGYYDLCIRLYGSEGTADTHYTGAIGIAGDKPWKGTDKDDTSKGAVTNVKNFVEAVRAAKPVNNVAVSVESNLTAVLGRIAAYHRRPVTWDEMLAAGEKLDAKLAL